MAYRIDPSLFAGAYYYTCYHLYFWFRLYKKKLITFIFCTEDINQEEQLNARENIIGLWRLILCGIRSAVPCRGWFF